jgi:ApaG protein
MNYIITNGIKVSIQVQYSSDFSKPMLHKYIFGYTVTIENKSFYPVQVLERQWGIFDSNGVQNLVQGPGILGEQPILPPDSQHSYTSCCPLNTDMGTMRGYYTMMNLKTMEKFRVKVPSFQLIAPFKMN